METASYPEDEAASHEKLKFRIENGTLIYGLFTCGFFSVRRTPANAAARKAGARQSLCFVCAPHPSTRVADLRTPTNPQITFTPAPDVFLLAVAVGGQGSGGTGGHEGGDEIVGYVCGTCSSASSLTHESMAAHDPDGALLCVHSVCVAEPHRRKGVATKLLSAYMHYVAGGSPHVQEARLLCKQHNVGLYERAGFELLGPSPVVHGAEQWLEMRRPLNDGGGGGGGEGASDE
jgi:GNAT superfamily N-acetyltransferase